MAITDLKPACAGLRAMLVSPILAAIFSGLCIALSFLYASCYALCWVGFVPLLCALRVANCRQAYWFGFVAGLTLQLIASYWMVAFIGTLKGYGVVASTMVAIVVWAYGAQLMAICATVFVWLRHRTGVHEIFVWPIVAATAWALFPSPLAAHLGESQSRFLPALQLVEFTGVYGLDWLIGVVNAAVFILISRGWSGRDRRWLGGAAIVFVGWMVYGGVALQRFDAHYLAAPILKIGIVQPDESPSVQIPEPRVGFSRGYPPEMEITETLAKLGATLTIWPETRYKGYFDSPQVRASYERSLKSARTALIFHDVEHVDVPSRRLEYNTALFLQSGVMAGIYRKNQRMAFGEYLPLVDSIPALHASAHRYLGEFFNTIERGSGPAQFRLGDVTVVPVICYETMFPGFVAEAVATSGAPRILVALSNDAWFGDSRQPYQHLNASIVRAVETRTPLIHAINKGSSGIVDVTGRLRFESDTREAGGHVVDVPLVATSPTFFMQYPRLVLRLLMGCMAILVVFALVRNQRATALVSES